MSLRVASLDVSSFRGRIGQEHVDELAGLIRTMNIDVLAVQGLTRYPGVSTRTDLIDALGARTGMRAAFGETIAVSGRQSGNAVLSAYPVESSGSRNFEGVPGSGFEGALEAIVDAGTRPVVIVSTRLPEPLTPEDERICAGTLSSIAAGYPGDPLIVLGNLPPPRPGDGWNTAGAERTGALLLWYTPRGISVRAGRGARCELGSLVVGDVDIYPRGRP